MHLALRAVSFAAILGSGLSAGPVISATSVQARPAGVSHARSLALSLNQAAGGNLAYEHYAPGINDTAQPDGLWLANADGTNDHEILGRGPSQSGAYVSQSILAWPEHGRKVIYQGYSDETFGTWEANADGSHPIALSGLQSAVISPDGSVAAVESGQTLVAVSVGSSDAGTTICTSNCGYPLAWAPDDSAVYTNNGGVERIPADGSAVADPSAMKTLPITVNNKPLGQTYYWYGRLAVSPDGSLLGLTAVVDSQAAMYTVSSDGGAAHAVPGQPAGAQDPHFSPSGRVIAFSVGGMQDPSTQAMYVMYASGGGAQLVGQGNAEPQPWQPVPRLGGTVYGERCNETACTKKGLANQTILVVGAATSGDHISESSVSNKKGEWSVLVPAGKYVVGPTLDGKKIDGGGFDPEQAVVTVRHGVAPHAIDFKTCNATPNASAPSSHFRSSGRQADYTGSPYCSSSYGFEAKATIPQSTFADPSFRAAYAPHEDGAGFRANNQDAGPWKNRLPECSVFDKERNHPRPLKWSTYYLGTAANKLGAARVTLRYNSWDKVITPFAPLLDAGSLTRVYVFQRQDGSTGRCSVTKPVVPMISTTSNNTRFEIEISWQLPYSPEGYATVSGSDLRKIPGVATNVHKAVEKIAEKIPAFEHLSPLRQHALVYVVAKGIEAAGVALTKLKSEEVAELIERAVAVEQYYNGAAGVYDFVAAETHTGQGYHSMDMVIRGKLVTGECPQGQKYRHCDDTTLGVDVSTDKFPDYRLTLLRNGKAVPTETTNPVTWGSGVLVQKGTDVATLPVVSESNMPPTKGSFSNMKEIWDRMRLVEPGATEAQAGAMISGVPKADPACTPWDTRTRSGLGPATSYTRCYTFGDHMP